ncbi:helicase-related protein [Streptomyces sp. FXJ1.172]|uniref:helicase-related protein n=1 Tax=Streptomyces sp. FXJ1.172 TaxID=710705 RepID=UPI000833F41D|nr:helicase-related protein [Streptomyces sp. FXJ1.172]WEO97180.1 helicase-related protein [Streptomyces sp. FXJ1.172]
MNNSTTGREVIVEALRRELLGPAPDGKPLTLPFADKESSYGPWTDPESGEEILERNPLVRYGVGVLYPAPTNSGQQQPDEQTELPGLFEPEVPDGSELAPNLVLPTATGPADDADFDLSGANERKPTAVGLSFMLERSNTGGLEILLEGGRYRVLRVDVPASSPRTWWVRNKLAARWRLSPQQLAKVPDVLRDLTPEVDHSIGLEGIDVRLTVHLDQHPKGVLVTAAIVNKSQLGGQALASKCVFQTSFTATPQDCRLLPYPGAQDTSDHSDDASFRLLYRKAQTYAVGHGCAATWEDSFDGSQPAWVAADPLPEFDVPRITPDIVGKDGAELTVSMEDLASGNEAGLAQLHELLAAYKAWIDRRKAEAESLEGEFRNTAGRHLKECVKALGRMQEGLALVEGGDDTLIAKAFRIANQAMFKQQARSGRERRKTTMAEDGRFRVEALPTLPREDERPRRGHWRAFQIAFLLASIPSTADPGHRHRNSVDLIFFPTGGGKTEAYLGLSAFSMALRRLRDPGDVSVTVLMRYTLRLLTTQQFLRAAALICALETIRDSRDDLGEDPFSIGIWVGGDSTPNSRSDAVSYLNNMERGGENPFLLLRCPWCAAQMGPVESTGGRNLQGARRRRGGRSTRQTAVAGYVRQGNRVVFQCPDLGCDFSKSDRRLPIHVVDDDVYAARPSMVIGTIDKFALLAWRPEARALFGIDDDGQRAYSPPDLVIQDELHLIAGPLGSIAGLYEGVVEELCTDYSGTDPVLPKIIASTATIRRYEEQVKSLYGRDSVHLFPPHGLEASDSFFAVYARDRETKRLLPGRKYIGVHAPALGSMQTAQVRSFSALLQAAQDAQEDERDPWWTLMAFFNSLRELGNSLSLLQSDIPDYLITINRRSVQARTDRRRLRIVEEMTSRLRQDQVPEAMEKLARTEGTAGAVDVCLASSLIEVGIDIDRLSLMTVVGQPKSTSQYIQVTGRVGRRADRPGLIVTLYGAAKPRDRSHFEHFRSYHQRLYAQVEPTSATPFAPPVLDRALHAALVAYIRQTIPRVLDAPFPFPEDLFEQAVRLLRARAVVCDMEEVKRIDELIEKRRREWTHWQPSEWGKPGGEVGTNQLMHPVGKHVEGRVRTSSWATPTSMRGADADCRAEVTRLYAERGAQQ